MFGFDSTERSVFQQTVDFNIAADYCLRLLDATAVSRAPSVGTKRKRASRIGFFDWTMYDQGHVVYRPTRISADKLRLCVSVAYRKCISRLRLATGFRCQASIAARNGKSINFLCGMARRRRTSNRFRRRKPSPILRQCRRSCPSIANGARRCFRRRKKEISRWMHRIPTRYACWKQVMLL